MVSKRIYVGGVPVGGGAPVTVQSMTNTKTQDIPATVEQIRRLCRAGCDIVRVAVPDMEAARAIGKIREACPVPLVADIHFDHRLALEAAHAGADKIRINPGNIGDKSKVKAVADLCREKKIPIRVGVNSGSVEKPLLAKYGGVTPEALAESAMGHVKLLNEFDFDDICISVKSSNVALNTAAYRLLREMTDYPLHVGVTEAGTEYMGIIKSAAGIGALLLDGIGDTIRVSLTADPVKEITAGIALLKALELRNGIQFISCPTCGRTRVDLIGIAGEVERRLSGCRKNLTIAVMGCGVNGPGEASHADFGIAGGDGEGILFARGKILEKVPADRLVDRLVEMVEDAG